MTHNTYLYLFIMAAVLADAVLSARPGAENRA